MTPALVLLSAVSFTAADEATEGEVGSDEPDADVTTAGGILRPVGWFEPVD